MVKSIILTSFLFRAFLALAFALFLHNKAIMNMHIKIWYENMHSTFNQNWFKKKDPLTSWLQYFVHCLLWDVKLQLYFRIFEMKIVQSPNAATKLETTCMTGDWRSCAHFHALCKVKISFSVRLEFIKWGGSGSSNLEKRDQRKKTISRRKKSRGPVADCHALLPNMRKSTSHRGGQRRNEILLPDLPIPPWYQGKIFE